MDSDKASPAKSLEERHSAAIARQGELIKALGMVGKPIIPDVLTAIARLRVVKELVIRAGLVIDPESGITAQPDEAAQLFDVLEAEAKAAVFADLLDAAMGRPNAHARQIMATAEPQIPHEHNGKTPH